MKTVNKTILSAPDTASQNGSQIDANQLTRVSLQAVFGDATAVGTLNLQVSNDLYSDRYQSSNFTVVNWSTISTSAVTSGACAPIKIDFFAYRWLRAAYTSTSGGSSTITVNMYALSE